MVRSRKSISWSGYLRDETGYLEYVSVAISTNELIGQLMDFIKKDPYFSQNTSIVVRPETGRDDEVNLYGAIHHSDVKWSTTS